MVLFLTIGLGSTMVSRMVLNLREWSRLREGEMHSLVHLATPPLHREQPWKSSSDFRIPQARTRQGSYSREASVQIDKLGHPSRQSSVSGKAKGTPNCTRDRGATIQTQVVTAVDNSNLPSVIDIEEQSPSVLRSPARRTNHDQQNMLGCLPPATSEAEVESRRNPS